MAIHRGLRIGGDAVSKTPKTTYEVIDKDQAKSTDGDLCDMVVLFDKRKEIEFPFIVGEHVRRTNGEREIRIHRFSNPIFAFLFWAGRP
jgi:hypothetical protein